MLLSEYELNNLKKLLNELNMDSEDGYHYIWGKDHIDFIKQMIKRVDDYKNGTCINPKNLVYEPSREWKLVEKKDEK